MLRFKDSLKLNTIHIQSANQLIFLTFLDSPKFAYIPFDKNNMADSILAQRTDIILQNNLYEFKSNDNSAPKIAIVDKYLQF